MGLPRISGQLNSLRLQGVRNQQGFIELTTRAPKVYDSTYDLTVGYKEITTRALMTVNFPTRLRFYDELNFQGIYFDEVTTRAQGLFGLTTRAQDLFPVTTRATGKL